MSVTHVAANHVYIFGRLIQRCAVCGEILINLNLERIAVPIEDKDKPLPIWMVGRLIQVDGPYSTMLPDDNGKLPPDTCFDLLENPDGN